ncbi:UDP-glucosyltransferase 2-like [Leptopilina heterotoma]|uniref:UDP-glucosyltransferase 2-like n=1 Tax=Leptopilina heterotoma TaxID=63436 RepID=UPI001CA8B79E|nr:UDP-glucosyltransferase 2-like [Leptopilina heterotoma]
MNLTLSFISCCLFFIINGIGSDGYRILAVFPYNSKSHNNMFEGVTKTLARNGHKVDVVSHFKLKNPPKNYETIINLEGTRRSVMNNFSIEFADHLNQSPVLTICEYFGNELCELMGIPEMQKLLKNPPRDPPYDLLITETFTAQCYIGIGYLLKVPVITISTTMELTWANDALGNPNSAAFVPNLLLSRIIEVSTFWDRLWNVVQIHQSNYQFYTSTGKNQTEAMRKYLDPNIPDIRQVERTVALTFINSFYSFNGVKSKTAAAIDIGGIHVEQDQNKLPSDFQKLMDESKEGVVYFTLGSMVLIETLPKETLLTFYAAFEKIAPIRVLMKIVNKEKLPPGLPSNVLVSNWIPQIPILRHNNTRLFMTHGGLLSSIEALYNGVPMIGFPIFGDQFTNVQLLVKKGMSISMDYKTLTEESLTEALNSVLYNASYRESAKRESQLYRDRPLKIGETVNFWVEYVIRHGPNVLKSPAIDLYWWQNELLDVYGFLTLCFLIIVTLIIKTLIFIMNQIFKHFVSSNGKSSKSFIKKD